MACSNKRSSSSLGTAGAGLGALRGGVARAGAGADAIFDDGAGADAGWAVGRAGAFSSRNGVFPKPGGGFFATTQ
jgi:hypothetical protein